MLAALRRRLPATDREDGFTLVEVLVSTVIFMIISAAAIYGIIGSQHSSLLTQQRVHGANLAQSYLAQVQPGQPLSDTLPTAAPTTTSDGYTVKFAVSPTGACVAGQTRSVSVLVYAPHTATTGQPVARTDGIVSC